MLFYRCWLVFFESFKLFISSDLFIDNLSVSLIVFIGFWLLIKFKAVFFD